MTADNDIKKVVSEFKAGKLVILPTDTLYAISCDAGNEKAVELVYQYKSRDKNKALPVLCSSISQIELICDINQLVLDFANKFWPGALTMVLPLKDNQKIVAKNVYNNHKDIAVRIPDSEMILNIIKQLNRPIVGTSANLSGHDPISSKEDAELVFGKNITFIKGESKSLFSTIIKIKDNSFEVLRKGIVQINSSF